MRSKEFFNPWDCGENRITEISIEQNFGHIRSMYASAQMTARQYWIASAKQALNTIDKLNGMEMEYQCRSTPKLTPQQFRDACENALRSSLNWVGRCSGVHPENLLAVYRQECQGSSFDPDLLSDVLGELSEKEVRLHEAVKRNIQKGTAEQCNDLIDHLKDEVSAEKGEEEGSSSQTLPDSELHKDLPDRDILIDLTTTEGRADPNHPFSSEPSLPATLRAALQRGGNFFNDLFQLSVFLRCGENGTGSDVGFLRNARGCRRRSKKLNWHQYNEYILAQEAEDYHAENPLHRQRTRRQDAWMRQRETHMEQLDIKVDLPEHLQAGNIVLASESSKDSLQLGLVLTVWRGLSKPKPATMPATMQQAYGFRMVCLSPGSDDHQIECNATSMAKNLKIESLFAVLDCTTSHNGLDKFTASLSEESVRLVQKAADVAGWDVESMHVELSMREAVRALESKSWPVRPRTRNRPKLKGSFLQKAKAALQFKSSTPVVSSTALAKQKTKTKKHTLKKKPADIVPLPEHFRRNDLGRRLLKQEMTKIRQLDAENFPKSPTFLDDKCRVKGASHGISWNDMLTKIDFFFERIKFKKFVKPDFYGREVHRALQEIRNELSYYMIDPQRA
jgi:hypothetical protein